MMCVDHVYLPPHLPLYLVDISLLLLRTPGAPHHILATVLPSSHAHSLIERLQKMFAQDLLFLRSLRIESPSQTLGEEDEKIADLPTGQETTGICTSEREL